MKPITYRCTFCVHTLGRRSQQLSRLTVLLFPSVMTNTWTQPALEQYVVGSGDVVTGVVVPTGGNFTQEVLSGATANSTTVVQIGTQQIFSGGITSGTVVSSGGVQQVTSSTANGTDVNSGGVEQVSGGTASGTTVNSAGTQIVVGSSTKPANLEAYVGYAREVGSTNRAVSVDAQDGTLFTAVRCAAAAKPADRGLLAEDERDAVAMGLGRVRHARAHRARVDQGREPQARLPVLSTARRRARMRYRAGPLASKHEEGPS